MSSFFNTAGVERGAVLFREQSGHVFLPYVTRGLDRTCQNRLRIPADFAFPSGGFIDKPSFRPYLSTRIFTSDDRIYCLSVKEGDFAEMAILEFGEGDDFILAGPDVPEHLGKAASAITRSYAELPELAFHGDRDDEPGILYDAPSLKAQLYDEEYPNVYAFSLPSEALKTAATIDGVEYHSYILLREIKRLISRTLSRSSLMAEIDDTIYFIIRTASRQNAKLLQFQLQKSINELLPGGSALSLEQAALPS